MKTVRIGSIGIPLPDTDAKIVGLSDHEKELPSGEKGELAIKGPQVMLGYWQNPEETKTTDGGGPGVFEIGTTHNHAFRRGTPENQTCLQPRPGKKQKYSLPF